jgi:Peptidase A4 family
VIGSWVQPPATCSAGESSWSSPWVGIDGDVSNTVEQIGTDTDCSGGTPYYYAWYEMYPKSLVLISSVGVQANQSFTAEVSGNSAGTFVLRLINTSTGASFTTTQSSKRSRRNSVEWVMEGPSSGLLTNFGTVGFTSASATISGQTAAVGSFANADPITMVNSKGLTRAVPSTPPSGDAFSVTWQHG